MTDLQEIIILLKQTILLQHLGVGLALAESTAPQEVKDMVSQQLMMVSQNLEILQGAREKLAEQSSSVQTSAADTDV